MNTSQLVAKYQSKRRGEAVVTLRIMDDDRGEVTWESDWDGCMTFE